MSADRKIQTSSCLSLSGENDDLCSCGKTNHGGNSLAAICYSLESNLLFPIFIRAEILLILLLLWIDNTFITIQLDKREKQYTSGYKRMGE